MNIATANLLASYSPPNSRKKRLNLIHQRIKDLLNNKELHTESENSLKLQSIEDDLYGLEGSDVFDIEEESYISDTYLLEFGAWLQTQDLDGYHIVEEFLKLIMQGDITMKDLKALTRKFSSTQ